MPPAHHYQRRDFTHDTYEVMASGFDPHRSLFGPRRTGKTSFLLHDLGPKATQFGHKVAYVDLWDRGPAPLALTLYELDRALGQPSGIRRVLSEARGLSPRVTLSALGAEVELDLTRKNKELPGDQVILLGQYLERLANNERPTFLFFDEFQEILRSPNHPELMAALRAGLSRHQTGFATVFTGSSQSRLRQVFSKKSAPFYRFTTELKLPPLGWGFIRQQLKLYPSSAPNVSEATANAVFERLNQNPDYFRRWLRLRAVSPQSRADEVLDEVMRDISDTLEFERIWLNLKDVHRLVLRLIAEGVSEIYGDAAQQRMAALGVEALPQASALQTAFNTLVRRDLVDHWEDERQITDPLFRRWVAERPETDFHP